MGSLQIAAAVIGLGLALSIEGWTDPSQPVASQRTKVIDFDDEVVEGMNKRPLDSVSQVSDPGKRARKPHLYRKRASFKSEIRETLRELRYAQ